MKSLSTLLLPAPTATLSPLADRRKQIRYQPTLRRPRPEQGRALEILAHALEYLIDSDLREGDTIQPATRAAVNLLAERSRSVFAGCPEVLPLGLRLRRLCSRGLASLRSGRAGGFGQRATDHNGV